MFTGVPKERLQNYTSQMRESIKDKLFFLEHDSADVYVDFGCADGSLLKELVPTGATLIGFDICDTMVQKARNNVGGHFFSDWELLLNYLHVHEGKNITLILSSVIHEVLSYGGRRQIEYFWYKVTRGPWNTVVIRDMAVSAYSAGVKRPDLAKSVRTLAPKWQTESFENHWGSLDYQINLSHFLLKYHYWSDWDRELKEDYLPIFFESIEEKMSGWRVTMSSHEILPYLERIVTEYFGFGFPVPTHAKYIFRRAYR